MQRSPRLSEPIGEVFLKREDPQVVRGYKVRGAYNVISQLPDDDGTSMSHAPAGNTHAQSLAYACSAFGVRSKVFLPRTTPRQKRNRIAALGPVRPVQGEKPFAARSCSAASAATGPHQHPEELVNEDGDSGALGIARLRATPHPSGPRG